MKLEDFENDDRFGVIDNDAIGCHGGTGPRLKQVLTTAAWLLDPENSTSFDAVLDPDDMQVARLDGDGYMMWEPLADFEA